MLHTSVMTSVAPWITPLILMLGGVLLGSLTINKQYQSQALPSLIGLICSGIGFSLPMVFFSDKDTFYGILTLTKILPLTLFISTCCFWGFMIASEMKKSVSGEEFTFPSVELFYDLIIELKDNLKKSFFVGLASSFSLLTVAEIGARITGFAVSIFPSMVSIGFFSKKRAFFHCSIGLLAAAVIRYCGLKFGFESSVFGLKILSGLLIGEMIKYIYTFLTNSKKSLHGIFQYLTIDLIFFTGLTVFCLRYILLFLNFSFSITEIIALLTISTIVSIEAIVFSGKIGTLPFGRFILLGIIPFFYIFKSSNDKISMACLFIAIVMAAAVASIFDIKLRHKIQAQSNEKVHSHLTKTILIFCAAAVISLVVIMIFKNIPLGTPAFFAQRSQTRLMLLNALKTEVFIPWGVGLSLLFHFLKIDTPFFVNGLIMPLPLSLAFMAGNIIKEVSIFQNKDKDGDFFFTGFFTAESAFVFISLLIKLFI